MPNHMQFKCDLQIFQLWLISQLTYMKYKFVIPPHCNPSLHAPIQVESSSFFLHVSLFHSPATIRRTIRRNVHSTMSSLVKLIYS